MSITKAHLAWSKLKCSYPPCRQAYKEAYAKLNNTTYADLERLRTEFDEYDHGSTPVGTTSTKVGGTPCHSRVAQHRS